MTVVLAMALALLVPGASAQSPDCGPFLPTAQITPGMTGQGLTVVQGTTPQTFGVEVLGVLRGGVGVGRDMIIVEVDAPFIDDVGGIWQGMSGSPVYVGGRLIGAVAYGLATASSSIGGLTPAEDMIDLIGLPDADAAFAADSDLDEVVLTGDLAAEVQRRVTGDAAATFDQVDQAGVSLRRLPVPLSVSGLSAGRLDLLQDATTRAGLSVTAHGGSAAPYAQVPATSAIPDPGDNLAVALSFGDVTVAAVGTATLVCDGHLIAFGHPFLGAGSIIAGAATADAITIVPDDTFSPYKLANIGAVFGTVDQDRFAGVRSDNSRRPPGIPVTSTVTDLDIDRSRDGRSDVIAPDLVADLAAFHLLGNIDSVIDRVGEGTSTIGYTVQGRGSDSGPFVLRRDNAYATTFDIAFESVFELLSHMVALTQFEGEDVSIGSVAIDATVQRAVDAYDITALRVGVDGAPAEEVGSGEVIVRPGSVLQVEVDLDATGSAPPVTEVLTLDVPADAYGLGFLDVTGGTGAFFDECLFDPQACQFDGEVETVQDLADSLAAQPRNDEVTASLLVPTLSGGAPGPTPTPSPEPPVPGPTSTPQPTSPPGEGGGEGDAGASAATPTGGQRSGDADGPRYAQFGDPVTDRAQVGRVVRGGLSLSILVDSPVCPGCPPVFSRVAGDERIGTAASIASAAYGASETVIVAPAGDYPSALIAGPLANREAAPVLLSGDGALSAITAGAIRDLGATRAIVVAPDGQLTGSVDADLTAAGITTIERIGGADRYVVAGAVAARMGGTRAWLVEGENADPARGWPDAISAAAVAGLEGVPILLTRAGDLPATTAGTLQALGITDISIAGGEAAVGTAVEADVAGRGIAVERIAGASRDETSYQLAQRAIELGAVPLNTWMVTAGDFPDALAAAPAVVHTGGVMIMGDGSDVYRTPGAVRHFADLRFTAPSVTFVGGFAAISQDVEEQVFSILIGQDGPPGEEPGQGEG